MTRHIILIDEEERACDAAIRPENEVSVKTNL